MKSRLQKKICRAAEAEFLNGPAGVSKPVEEDAFEDIEELTDMPEELSLDEAVSEDDAAEKTAEKLDDVATVVEEETPLDEEEEYSTDDVSAQSEAEDDEEDVLSQALQKIWKRTTVKKNSRRKSSLSGSSRIFSRKLIRIPLSPEKDSSQMKRNSFSPILLQFPE